MVSQIYLLLHNIRSTHNVGSVFRTADAVGVKKIYISGYTPAPKDRFGRDRTDIAKVSLGAEKDIEWEQIEDPKELIKKLKKEKVEIISLEQHKSSINYKEIKIKEKMLVILGEEVNGVEEDILKMSDQIAEIPMHGNKESLNVSVAAGVLLYSLR
jgi:23S rRNA (guanosine2251-2'-O)-methyltransferase